MNLSELKVRTGGVSLAKRGDSVEIGAVTFLRRAFQGYELFWRLFVYPYRMKKSVHLNPNLPRSHEAVCIYNYSVMRSVVRLQEYLWIAEGHKDVRGNVTSEVFDDFFIRLCIAHSQVRQMAGATYMALVKREDKPKRSIKQWEKLCPHMRIWLDKSIPDNSGADLEAARTIDHRYRNNIVHGAKWPGHLDRVPNSDNLPDLMYWSECRTQVGRGEEDWHSKSVDRLDLIQQRQTAFLKIVNSLWEQVTDAILQEMSSQPPINESLIYLKHENEGRSPTSYAAYSSEDQGIPLYEDE